VDKLNVAFVIPAYNEEKNLPGILEDLKAQQEGSCRVVAIVVVDDVSTDNTPQVVKDFQEKMSNLRYIRNETSTLRAGAMNRGIFSLNQADVDLVIAIDADCRAASDLADQAAQAFLRDDETLGGVCSRFGVLSLETLMPNLKKRSWHADAMAWILWRLQKLEGAGFDASRTATHENVLILHGLCSAYRLKALQEVGGFPEGHLIEDYATTMKLKRRGYTAKFCPSMRAWTDVPLTIKSLLRQRERWGLGGLQVLQEFGIDRNTLEDAINHVAFIGLFLVIFCSLVLNIAKTGTIAGGWNGASDPMMLLSIAVALVGYTYSVYQLTFLEKRDWVDYVVKLALIPELAYAMLMSGLQVVIYVKFLGGSKGTWYTKDGTKKEITQEYKQEFVQL